MLSHQTFPIFLYFFFVFSDYITSETKSIFEDYTTSRRHLSVKPYCEKVSAFIEQEVHNELKTEDGWDICIRNNEYMIYDGDNDDYLPTCVGAGEVGSTCDESLLVCTLDDSNKMDLQKEQIETILVAIRAPQYTHEDCPRVKEDCDFDAIPMSVMIDLGDLGWTTDEIQDTLCKWNDE